MSIYHFLINLPDVVENVPVCFHWCDFHLAEANRYPCECDTCGSDIYVTSICNCKKSVPCVGCVAESESAKFATYYNYDR